MPGRYIQSERKQLAHDKHKMKVMLLGRDSRKFLEGHPLSAEDIKIFQWEKSSYFFSLSLHILTVFSKWHFVKNCLLHPHLHGLRQKICNTFNGCVGILQTLKRSLVAYR